jgi:hypothetical protein
MQDFLLGAHGKTYVSTPTSTTRVQLHSAPRLLVIRPHELYINLVVRRDYSSPSRTGSTSIVPRASRLLVLRSHWLYVIFTIDHRDSIADRHGFVYKSAQATTAMSFIEMIIFFVGVFSSSCRTTCRLPLCTSLDGYSLAELHFANYSLGVMTDCHRLWITKLGVCCHDVSCTKYRRRTSASL